MVEMDIRVYTTAYIMYTDAGLNSGNAKQKKTKADGQ